MAEARSLGLLSKSWRLLFAKRSLMASGGSLPHDMLGLDLKIYTLKQDIFADLDSATHNI